MPLATVSVSRTLVDPQIVFKAPQGGVAGGGGVGGGGPTGGGGAGGGGPGGGGGGGPGGGGGAMMQLRSLMHWKVMPEPVGLHPVGSAQRDWYIWPEPHGAAPHPPLTQGPKEVHGPGVGTTQVPAWQVRPELHVESTPHGHPCVPGGQGGGRTEGQLAAQQELRTGVQPKAWLVQT